MNTTTALVITGASLIIFLKLFWNIGRKRKAAGPTPIYTRAGPLASPTELAFLQALDAALEPSQRIFMKVRLIDVIAPESGLLPQGRFHAKSRVIQKHLDYVICDRETTNVLFAIELNDKSHNRRDRQERDNFVTEAMNGAGVPLLFFPAAMKYSPELIRVTIEKARYQRP